MESINLLGADDVRSAGSRIAAAADTMRQAASNFDGTVDRMRGIFDDFLQRLDHSLEVDRTERAIAVRNAVLKIIPKPTTAGPALPLLNEAEQMWIAKAQSRLAEFTAGGGRAPVGSDAHLLALLVGIVGRLVYFPQITPGAVNVAAVPHDKLVEALKPFRSPALVAAVIAGMSGRYLERKGGSAADDAEALDDLAAVRKLADVMPALIALVDVGHAPAGVPAEVRKMLVNQQMVSVLFHDCPISRGMVAGLEAAEIAYQVDAFGALRCTKNRDGEI